MLYKSEVGSRCLDSGTVKQPQGGVGEACSRPTEESGDETTSRRTRAHHAVAMNANVLNTDLAGWCGKE